jgi:threonine/homoserine/homoserine lactone efflux protein
VLLAIPGAFSVMKIRARVSRLARLQGVDVPCRGEGTVDIAPETSTPSRWHLFRTAFTISISNPKALVFAAAFLPLFLDPARPKSGQFAVMVATFGVVEFSWYFIYALGGRSLARWLQRPERRRLFNRVTGGVFVAFGLAMAGTRA